MIIGEFFLLYLQRTACVSIRDFLSKIGSLQLSSAEVDDLVSRTVEKALKRFGKKLTPETIREFRKILLKEKGNKSNTHKSSATKRRIKKTFEKRSQRNNHSGVRSLIGAQYPLSNFFLCNFIYAYQWEKASLFGFTVIARKIETSRTAAQVKGFTRETPYLSNWDRIRVLILRELLRLKWDEVFIFRQDCKNVAVRPSFILFMILSGEQAWTRGGEKMSSPSYSWNCSINLIPTERGKGGQLEEEAEEKQWNQT